MATATTKTKTKATQTKTQAKRTATQAKQTTQAAKSTAEQAQRTVKTLVTDSAYATLGVTDRAAAFVRSLNEVRVEAPEKLVELRRQAPEYVRTVRTQTVSTAQTLRDQARSQFDELAELGRKRAESIRRTRKTREARDQVDATRSQVKAAATSLGRAVGTNVEAAAKIVEKAGTTVSNRRQPQRTQPAADQRPYEERTVEELRERAAELNIEGRSQMSKDELVKALRDAS
jgi:hypothetical protein